MHDRAPKRIYYSSLFGTGLSLLQQPLSLYLSLLKKIYLAAAGAEVSRASSKLAKSPSFVRRLRGPVRSQATVCRRVSTVNLACALLSVLSKPPSGEHCSFSLFLSLSPESRVFASKLARYFALHAAHTLLSVACKCSPSLYIYFSLSLIFFLSFAV